MFENFVWKTWKSQGKTHLQGLDNQNIGKDLPRIRVCMSITPYKVTIQILKILTRVSISNKRELVALNRHSEMVLCWFYTNSYFQMISIESYSIAYWTLHGPFVIFPWCNLQMLMRSGSFPRLLGEIKCLKFFHIVIFSFLFSDEKDPFNRSPLKLDQVIPCQELKERIQAWLKENSSVREDVTGWSKHRPNLAKSTLN